MKKKKIFNLLVLILIVLIILGIYHFFRNDKLNYVALGDSLAEGMNPYGEIGYSYTDYLADYLKDDNKLSYYTKEYTESSQKSTDMIELLNNNSNLKKDLRESNIVTISIGANDLLNKVNKNELNINNILAIKSKVAIVLPNIEKSIKEVRKYAKKDIIIVGYYNPIPFLFNTSSNDLDKLFAYIDNEYQKIADKYDCDYISIYQQFKNNSSLLPNPTDIHPNLKGYELIAQEIFNYYSQKESYQK